MKRSFLAWSFLLGVVHRAVAIPVFNTANDYDLNGNACPLPPQYDVSCPVMCVTNYALCPAAIAPACPTGQTFCADGTCHASCESIENICTCGNIDGSSMYADYVPCMAGMKINITYYDTANGVQQIRDTCAAAAQINSSSNIGVWGVDTDKVMIWTECPAVSEPYFTFREPMWVAVWALVGIEAVLLALWHLYKTAREFRFHKIMAAAAVTPVLDGKEKKMWQSESSSVQESEKLTFRGFNTDYFGSFVFGSVVTTTLLFLIFLSCIVSDYYGTLDGRVYGVFLTGDLSSMIFCAVWHISAAWFAILLLSRKRILNYYRIESFAHKCTYVQVERRQEEIIFLSDDNKLIAKMREIEQSLSKRLRMDILVETHKIMYTANNVRFFEYQCMRYVYSEDKHRYEPYAFDLGETNKTLCSYIVGLTSEEAALRLDMLGENVIKVHVPSIPLAIAQEFASFLYLYQMMCMWVWYYFQYFRMGLVQTSIILVSAVVRVVLRLRAEHRVKDMAEFVSQVPVLRDGEWKDAVSTSELVPGDVFTVNENTELPCDAVILSGIVVANESSLTGEAMPVRKFELSDDDIEYDMMGASKSNTLFAGTTVAQITPSNKESRVLAMALRTGISSEKGMLIHKILFPAPVSFIFNEHIKLAICILLLWGGIAFALSMWWMGRGNITSWFYGVFIISEIFSPLLPAAFTINQSVSAARLRMKKILCLDLPRIILSGKVRIFCFDKTGTLTREGLEFYGAVDSKGVRTDDPSRMEKMLAMGIATCHAVAKVKDQYIGNPVDIESFRSMQWDLQPPADPAYLDTITPLLTAPNQKPAPVHIIRRFEFVHARASQSVAVLDQATQHVHVFLKGSFERIQHLALSDSLPEDYGHMSAYYAREGCYVLALAHRDLGELDKSGLTMDFIKSMSRDELEKGCAFRGFVLFRNMLKNDTPDGIAQLRAGDTRTVMITGDTSLTGIYIARQCGMIEPNQTTLLGDISPSGAVVWHDVDTGEEVNVDKVLDADLHDIQKKQVELAMTGRAFETLINQGLIRSYILHARVFSRMTPTNKVQCVRLLMEFGVTAMCGDGGNDCGALRAAHVGLALSEAEASIVSPFSTNNRSIMQCVELLKQGRASLATSFANYKFLIFYGECMAFWELLMFYFTVIAPQSIWITIDGFIVTFMTFAITQARPAKTLGPSRPTAKPIGPYTILSIGGVVFINFWFLVCSVVWLFQQEWFVCHEFDSATVNAAFWWLLGDNYEAEVVSLVIIFQFFHNAAIVNFGSVFRQSWWRNYVLVAFYCCFFVSTSFMTLADPNPYSCIFRINCGTASALTELGYPTPTWDIPAYNSPLGHNVMPKSFRYKLWVYILSNLAATVIWERFIVQYFLRNWAVNRNKTSHPKQRAVFKL